MDLEVRVQNIGTATAKNIPFVPDRHNLSPHPPVSDLRAGYGWFQEDRHDAFRSELFHPRMPPRKVFNWSWTVPANYKYSAQGNGFVPLCDDPAFHFTVYAEDQQPQSFRVRFDREEVTRFRRLTVTPTPEEEDGFA
jgi:hypothetical protein